MVGLLTRMKLTVLRRSMNGPRAASMGIGALVGLGVAVGTVWLGFLTYPSRTAAVGLFSLVFLIWTLGWVVGPTLTGGDATLRLEFFSLLPVRTRRLAVGLLGSSLAGITPIVTLIAFCLLIVYGIRLGPAAAIVAVPAIILQLIFVVLLSRVTLQALGRTMRSRVGWELSALAVGFVIAFLNTGWFAIGFFLRLFTSRWADELGAVVRTLPSGWAVVAVDAAGRSDWPLVVAALGGLLGLSAVLLLLWTELLARELIKGSAGGGSRAVVLTGPSRRRLLPATASGAVVGKELRLWSRDPRRARFLRIALWIGVFTAVLPLLTGRSVMVPWAGVVAVFFAGAFSANVYGLDAGALWLTMMPPGVERADVRGRQWAWLLVVAPVALTLTAAAALLPVPGWSWAWVLAVLPAGLGAAVGLIPLVSIFAAAPFPDRPGGNALDGFSDESGDQVRLQTLLVLLLELLAAAPAAGVVLAGTLLRSSALRWAGVPVGVITGVALAWLFGRLAARRLTTHGPEILDVMRGGPRRSPAAVEDGHRERFPEGDLPTGAAAVVGLLITTGILLLLPQGIIALFLGILHAPVRGWFVALHFEPPVRPLVSAASILLGALTLWLASRLIRGRK